MAQDSSRPDFWDTRFRSGATPWDAAGVPPRLVEWLVGRKTPSKVLIPGCGSGYEVRAFAERGHDVLAIDFSDAALEAARRELGGLAGRVGKAGFFFFDDNEKGPPYGVAPHALMDLLKENFTLESDVGVPSGQSIPVFKDREHWQVWRRKL